MCRYGNPGHSGPTLSCAASPSKIRSHSIGKSGRNDGRVQSEPQLEEELIPQVVAKEGSVGQDSSEDQVVEGDAPIATNGAVVSF
jgi:hypothetical protein